jgi:hypothetical protein
MPDRALSLMHGEDWAKNVSEHPKAASGEHLKSRHLR